MSSTKYIISLVLCHKCVAVGLSSPILALEVRGKEVGEDSRGRVSESVILRIV